MKLSETCLLVSPETHYGEDTMHVDGGNDDTQRSELTAITDKIEQLQGFIANEEAKFANWKVSS